MEILLPEVLLWPISPILAVTATGLILLLIDLALPREKKHILGYLAILGLIVAGGFSLSLWGQEMALLKGMVLADGFSGFFNLVFIAIGALTILLSIRYLKEMEIHYGEYHVLITFSVLGMMVMASAGDLLMIFLGLELLSVPIYILAGFLKRDVRSNESSLKYFLLGAFAAAFFIYGIALIYGAAGTTNVEGIATFLKTGEGLRSPLMVAGMGFVIVGLGFKVALVPFHMWTPDAYEGAPVSVTAFMSVGPKAAGFAALLRVLLGAVGPLRPDWVIVLWMLAVLTMTVGNVVAIAQTNIKRMLAYSSIAHAGYILVAVVAGGELGASAVLFYVVVYTLMNLGAFGTAILLSSRGMERVTLTDFTGLGVTHPVVAAAMALFMLSLTGIPPTGGFVGKFYLFSAAVKAGFTYLAVIAVINSALSVYYYLRVILVMYMAESRIAARPLMASPSLYLAVALTAFGTMALGIYPSFFLSLAEASVRVLM